MCCGEGAALVGERKVTHNKRNLKWKSTVFRPINIKDRNVSYPIADRELSPFLANNFIQGRSQDFSRGRGGVTLCQPISSWCFRHGIL